MEHRGVGRLRDRGCPVDVAWLDRLVSIYPAARLHWVPSYSQFGVDQPVWLIANHTGSHVYRDLGRAMYDRANASVPVDLGTIYAAELMMDGGIVLQTYPPDALLTSPGHVLDDLREMQLSLADVKAEVMERAHRKTVAAKMAQELAINPGYEEHVAALMAADPELVATINEMTDRVGDDWAVKVLARKSFSSAGRPREVGV